MNYSGAIVQKYTIPKVERERGTVRALLMDPWHWKSMRFQAFFVVVKLGNKFRTFASCLIRIYNINIFVEWCMS